LYFTGNFAKDLRAGDIDRAATASFYWGFAAPPPKKKKHFKHGKIKEIVSIRKKKDG